MTQGAAQLLLINVLEVLWYGGTSLMGLGIARHQLSLLMWVLQTWCAVIGNQIDIMYRLKSVHIKWSSMCLKACAPQDMHYTHKNKWSCVQVVTQKLRVVQFHTKSWSSRHVQYIISFPQPMSRICGGWNLSKEGLLKRTRVIWVTGSMVTSNLI